MPVNNTTSNRGYQLPHPTNFVDEDILRLISALNAIDVDVASLFTSMSGKASASHGHVIGDISGLASALANKLDVGTTFTLDSLSDVDVSASTDTMFLRKVGGVWVGVAFDGSMITSGTINGARLGSHMHAISDVSGLQTALDGKQTAGSYAPLSHSHTPASLGLGANDTVQHAAIELGHASDTTVSRAAAGKIAVEGQNVLLAGTAENISKGFTVSPNNLGTVTSGTLTPNAQNGNYQFYTNNGAHTIAAPVADSAIDILVTNGATAGSITFSGFTVGAAPGSPYNTTNGNRFILSIRRINGVATYSWYALQ